MRANATVLTLLFVAGCAADPEGGSRGSGSASPGAAGPSAMAGDNGTVVFHNVATGTGCATPNLTQACACDAVAGRQVCGSNTVWGACECLDPAMTGGGAGAGVLGAAADPALNKAEAHFDWLRSEPGSGGGSGGCEPGHYGGSLDGIYNAPSAFTAPVPIVSVDVTGAPGLQIDLAEGGGGEFLTVTGGKLNGTALAIFPFEAEFADGSLDCATGLFQARVINGSYVVFFDGFYGGKVTYQFEGEIVARYDAATQSLVDGRWSVSEGGTPPPAISPDQPPPVFPPAQAGGTGTWTAKWMR